MRNLKFLIPAMFISLLLTVALAACSSEDVGGVTPQKKWKGRTVCTKLSRL